MGDSLPHTAPAKGTVVPLTSGTASLPPKGVQPTPLVEVSPQCNAVLSNFSQRMLVPPDQLDHLDIARTKSYSDPSLRQRAVRVRFAADLWESGMLAYTSSMACMIAVFFVMKSVGAEGQWILRPVWDARKPNKYFLPPAKMGLGTPAGLCEIDLSDSVGEGQQLAVGQGDVPDFFHRCATPECLWPYFVLDVSVQELYRELRCRKVSVAPPPSWAKHVALRVAAMGFSWAPFLCHSALEDILRDAQGSLRPRSNLLLVSVQPDTPQLQASSFDMLGNWRTGWIVRMM